MKAAFERSESGTEDDEEVRAFADARHDRMRAVVGMSVEDWPNVQAYELVDYAIELAFQAGDRESGEGLRRLVEVINAGTGEGEVARPDENSCVGRRSLNPFVDQWALSRK